MGNSFPKVLHCVVCDDARVEQGGLLTLTGVFGIVPDFTILVDDFRGHIPRLTFVFISGPGEGSFNISLDITDMNGKSIFPSPVPDLKISMEPSVGEFSQLILGIGNPKFPAPGKYEIQFKVDGSLHYQETLNLRQNELVASANPTSQQSATTLLPEQAKPS